jgi:serine protease
MLRRFAVLFAVLLGVLVACDESPPDSSTNPNGKPVAGEISGTIVFSNLPAVSISPVSTNSDVFINAEFVPGEVLIKTIPGLASQSLSGLSVRGATLTKVRSLALEETGLYRVAGLNEQGTLELIDTLKARPDIADAVPNYLFYSTRSPNDSRYRDQWYLPGINVPAAWDRTTGSSAVTVAVIDTGIIPHPDFGGRLLPGYDFVSALDTAADGNGRDSDPQDPGPFSKTGYHGTHVAGIIGAASNNSSGVAGVDWGARLLPVRALGPAASGSGAVGTLADVTDGALWAAGLSVAGVPANPTPADVLNFSLGGNVPCSSIQQEAFDDIFAAGKIVVVAAGNSTVDAGSFSPANCEGVIVVGATARDGRRASYSNYGSKVDIMAPGGDSSNAILSLGKDDSASNGQYDYVLQAGTSMASPQIAGIAALMKSLAPSLTQSQVLSALTSTARVLTNDQCDAAEASLTLNSSDCGAGLVDAARALSSISTTPQPDPSPTPTPDPINLAGMQVYACLTIVNNECKQREQVSVSGQGESVTYSFRNLGSGSYVIVAWKDVNGNEEQDAGDIEGIYKNAVGVRPPASSINFTVTTTTSASTLRGLD